MKRYFKQHVWVSGTPALQRRRYTMASSACIRPTTEI